MNSAIGQKGFTLIETILALSITAILLISVLSALRLGISSWERGEELIDRSSVKRSVIYRLEKEAASIYPFTIRDKERKIAFVGKSDSVGFATVAEIGSKIPGARWVYYTLGEDGLIINEKYLNDEDLLSFSGGEVISIEPGITGVAFEYQGKDGWSRVWDPRKDEFPRALRAEVMLKGGDKFTILLPVGAAIYGRAGTSPG